MADSVATMLDDVDANMDYRKQLVEALRSKLGDEELTDDDDEDVEASDSKIEGADFESSEIALEPQAVEVEKEQKPDASIEYLTDFLYEHSQEGLQDVFQQMDRGLDERQRLISSLKSQLSKSAAIPKVALACPPAAVASATPNRDSVIDLEENDAEIISMPPAKVARTVRSAVSPVAQTPPTVQAVTPLTPLAPLTPLTPLTPLAPLAPQTPIAPAVAPVNVTSVVAPSPVATAEAAELAARKAAMLRSLQEAETMGQLKAANASHPPSPAVGSSALPFPQPTAATRTLPQDGSTAAPGSAPDCPPGSTPEEYEAYRRKCWEEYYKNQAEFSAVWKKYYNQNQAEQTGKGKTKSKLRPMGGANVGTLALAGKGGCGQPRAVIPPLSINPAAGLVSGGKGNLANFQALAPRPNGVALSNRGLAPRPVAPLEDIHSKLLGL